MSASKQGGDLLGLFIRRVFPMPGDSKGPVDRLVEWFKRLVAGKELAELDRWRFHWRESRFWLKEFEDSRDALDQLRQRVDGVRHYDYDRLQDNMRKRRIEREGRA